MLVQMQDQQYALAANIAVEQEAIVTAVKIALFTFTHF